MNRNDWARAMTEAKKRKDCVWFRVNRGYNKSWLVRSDDQASCCSWINRGLAGRTRMVDHLHTYRHFEKWCREHPAQGVLVRFPEVRDLLAEIVLSEHKKDIKDGDVAASLMGLITNSRTSVF